MKTAPRHPVSAALKVALSTRPCCLHEARAAEAVPEQQAFETAELRHRGANLLEPGSAAAQRQAGRPRPRAFENLQAEGPGINNSLLAGVKCT